MRKSPHERAEACFAVARSTEHRGERDAAIGRGEAICRRYGLDLDDFDVPGRQRAATRPPGPELFERTIHVDGSARASRELSEQLNRMREAMFASRHSGALFREAMERERRAQEAIKRARDAARRS